MKVSDNAIRPGIIVDVSKCNLRLTIMFICLFFFYSSKLSNVALNKESFVSVSTVHDDASRAVDGKMNVGSPMYNCTIVKNSGVNPWWQVDLAVSHFVRRVTITACSVTPGKTRYNG